MRGGKVPKHYAFAMTTAEAYTLRRIIEDARELSERQTQEERQEWRLSDEEDALLAELVSLLAD